MAINQKSQPVTGIEGYREFNNKYYEPYFTIELPSNWHLEEQKLESQEGHWISVQGPFNSNKTRRTSLDIYLITQGTDLKYQSLDAYVESSIKQESIGKSQILSDQPYIIDGITGREIRIAFDRAYPTSSGIVQVTVVKQWMTLFVENHIIQVFYESPQENFDTYFEVYQRALETIRLFQK